MNCVICNTSKLTKVKEGKFYFIYCNTCGVKYHYPLPTTEYLANWYSSKGLAKRWKGNILTAINTNYKQNKGNYKSYLDLIKDVPVNGSALDIGCYAGHFLTHLILHGFTGIGIDLNAGLIEYGKKTFNIDLRHGDVSTMKFSTNYFRLITCHQVLEHVNNPYTFLKEINRILTPGGFIAISVPDASCNKKISYPEHLFHFTKNSIAHLLTRLSLTFTIAHNAHQKALFVLGRKSNEGV